MNPRAEGAFEAVSYLREFLKKYGERDRFKAMLDAELDNLIDDIVTGTYKVTVTATSSDGTIIQSVDVAVIIGQGEKIIQCGGDSDCSGGQICVGGGCYTPCKTDASCPDGCKCTIAPGRSDGASVCVCNNIIMSCNDVQVPGDGTQISAPVGQITMPDNTWKIIFDYYDHDNYVLNGDASFNLVYNGDGTATIIGTFKNKGWPCNKKLKIGLIVAGGQVGTTNFPPALTCWFNIVINCTGMFLLQGECDQGGNYGCTGASGWTGGAITCKSSYGSLCVAGGSCSDCPGASNPIPGYVGHLRLVSVQGFSGTIAVTNSGTYNLTPQNSPLGISGGSFTIYGPFGCCMICPSIYDMCSSLLYVATTTTPPYTAQMSAVTVTLCCRACTC